jgi:glycyl-tRNA synthetase
MQKLKTSTKENGTMNQNLYFKNGFLFYDEAWINKRERVEQAIKEELFLALQKMNSAFKFFKIEAPLITPYELINNSYSKEDLWSFSEFAMRPETTMGSFTAAREILSSYNELKVRLPIVVYQHGKSFRKEQDQPSSKVKLKEFYQLEFQILYSPDTKNDYSKNVISALQKIISLECGKKCSIEKSDRLPKYSLETTDIMCEELEICSISKRQDFDLGMCLEVAVGTDRINYKYFEKHIDSTLENGIYKICGGKT